MGIEKPKEDKIEFAIDRHRRRSDEKSSNSRRRNRSRSKDRRSGKSSSSKSSRRDRSRSPRSNKKEIVHGPELPSAYSRVHDRDAERTRSTAFEVERTRFSSSS